MSRSGYSEDSDDQWELIMYRGRVASAIRGKRGQAFLLEALAALDAMPEKKLIAKSLKIEDGAMCVLGAVGQRRGFDAEKMKHLDQQFEFGAQDYVASQFGIAEVMVREIVWENDDGSHDKWIMDENQKWCRLCETPEQRFARVRSWIVSKVRPVPIADIVE